MNGGVVDFIEENGNGSDSDANSDGSPEYYEPISAVDDEGSSEGDDDVEFRQLPNGFGVHDVAENGISSLDLNDQKSSDEEEEEEEEEEERRQELETAMREDENRRNAPLTAENATRVMEAMRGVSFAGVAPEWVAQVPEDRWIDQLRRLRQSSNT
ncbi:bone sialoprotein 2 [Abrus precatorius]|uniref:Bone sialoprotein 2 n=1 Tax=Abrus precatorius TaxID=3816 RepID=A0A8B8JV58_ABRPR|nr:bone sialoprotein 2 [Abrus precatorius]